VNWPDVLLVVGNGLSIDLKASLAPRLDAWPTSSPLSWHVIAPDSRFPSDNYDPSLPMLAFMYDARMALARTRELEPEANDFELLNAARNLCVKENSRSGVIELRHLIAISYSVYQGVVDQLDLSDWVLGKNLTDLIATGRVLGAVSFNYDLNLETIIENAQREVWDLADVDGVRGGVPVFKPHGSIHYELPLSVWEPNDWDLSYYPLNNTADHFDAGVRLLPRDQLYAPRALADLVLPAETSTITGFQAVRRGATWLSRVGPWVKMAIILGVSYMPVDREEIDQILSVVPKSATVVVIDPYPSEDLMRELRGRFANVLIWRSGFESL